MNTPYRPLCLALLLANAPFPTLAESPSKDKEDERITDTKYKKKNTTSQQGTKENWSTRAQQIGIGIVAIGSLYLLYLYTKGNGTGNDGNTNDIPTQTPIQKYKQRLTNLTNGEKAKATQCNGQQLLRAKVDQRKTFLALLQENTRGRWNNNKNTTLVNAIATICTDKGWDITSDKGDPQGNYPAIANFTQGMIDDTDENNKRKPTERQAAYALMQILYCVADLTNQQKMIQLVNQKNNRFLANLVQLHKDKDEGCYYAIHTLCHVGHADPAAKPSFGSGLFKNNTDPNAQTIEYLGSGGFKNALRFRKEDNLWTVSVQEMNG